MSVQPIRLFGDPVLRSRAAEVVNFDKELHKLVVDLEDTMQEQGGAGLAAPQIGVGLRVFTYNCGGSKGHIVNPHWAVIGAQEQVGPEGCLSIPGFRADCRRSLNVIAHGFSQDGEPITLETTEILARCIQHETDHLDGVLFIDRLEPEQRKQAMKFIRQAPWFGLVGSTNSLLGN